MQEYIARGKSKPCWLVDVEELENKMFPSFSHLQSYREIFQTWKKSYLLDFIPELVITEQFPKYQVKTS